MTEVDRTATKYNTRDAFATAPNGAIAVTDIESITLSQKEQAMRGRRAARIDVTITLKSKGDQSTAANAAAQTVEIKVFVGGVSTTVTKTATVAEIERRQWVEGKYLTIA